MAEIFLAKRRGPMGFERPVVIKRVLPHLAEEEEFRNMFLDEARIAAALHHPNVVNVQELGQIGGELYLVMEYLGGENVGGLIKAMAAQGERIDHALTAHIVAEACAGLHAAHELRDLDGQELHIVHRDVSPQNIFITYEGAVKVLDFGIAKARERYTQTRTGQLKGKFAYMAPEQCRNHDIDRRADLWALGAVLYELSTGHRVFGRPSELGTIVAITEEEIPPPSAMVESYPPSLEQVVHRALARDPDDRYATAAEMRSDLIAVVRELAPKVDMQAQLASRMKQVFGRQMREKTEMLRQLPVHEDSRDSGTFSKGGRVEVGPESTTELLLVPRPPALPSELESFAFELGTDPDLIATTVKRESVRPALLAAGLGALAMAVVLIGVAVLSSKDEPTEAAPPPHVAQSEAPTIATAVAPAAEPAAAAPSGEREVPAPLPDVHVRIDSDPPGAAVLWDGQDRGHTPLDLVLERDTARHRVELRLEGYDRYAHDITPDVDQRIHWVLEQSRPRAGSSARHPRPHRSTRTRRSGGGNDGFYVFD
jgi:serine/threonine-protein kinase